MIESLILFHKEIRDYTDKKKISFEEMNKKTVLRGYIVPEEACTEEVYAYIMHMSINPNATFYKTWNDIISRNRFELFVDQIRHYASTYGTAFQGIPYIPNSNPVDMPKFDNLQVLEIISREEAIQLCLNMLFSGIALEEKTIKLIWAILLKLHYEITSEDMEKIKNKEVRMYIYASHNTVPTSPVEFVRFLVYKATGKTLLIKDRDTIDAIKSNRVNLTDYLNSKNMATISSVFFRFKPLFLAFRYTAENRYLVNRLRKLANHNHKPKVAGFWDTALRTGATTETQMKHMNEITNFKKIALIEEIMVRNICCELSSKPYAIRNGKMFIDCDNVDRPNNLDTDCLYQSLVDSISKKACRVKLPKNVNLAVPRSEKSFIGDYPLYTSVSMDADTVVGIYWREKWGAKDFDLSFLGIDGTDIAWNADFKDGQDVVFSGDMTSANPEAAELMYFRNGYDKCGMLHIRRYYGKENSKFQIFVAKENISKMCRNYMVDPNNIVLQADAISDSVEKSVAITAKGKLYLASFRTGNKRVGSDRNSVSTEYAKFVRDTVSCHLSLYTLLLDAGFQIVDEDPDIDLSHPTKEAIISILS